MSTTLQTYKQAMHNLSVANMLRTENKITLLLCKPKDYKGVHNAWSLYDIHYELRVGEYNYDEEFEEEKRRLAQSLLSYMINELDIQYHTINYYNFVMEIERSFWNSENWNKSPVDFMKEIYDEYSFYRFDQYAKYFIEQKELKALKYIMETVIRI